MPLHSFAHLQSSIFLRVFRKNRRTKAAALSLLFLSAGITPSLLAQETPNVVVRWNIAALQGVRDSKLGPPMVSRGLAIAHTCMYDAWAAYDARALGTQLGSSLRVPPAERTLQNKEEAISFAAYRALVDIFPGDDGSVFRPLMLELGYNPDDLSQDKHSASGIGNLACAAVLQYRHTDGSNQLGDLSGNGVPYADYTGYIPLNPPGTVPPDPKTIVDPNHWQPLQYRDLTGTLITQKFLAPQWGKVRPFALPSGSQFRSALALFGPATYGTRAYQTEVEELVRMSADLTDEQKMMAEYFADGPRSELPPGHWNLFAQFVSARDHHGVDADAKMFFALTNAMFDASIACWDAKRAFDSVRPATAIPFVFQGQQIRAWGGPGKGTVTMDGKNWIPYQLNTSPTPAFPEYISGHSSFSAAGAEILKMFTGSDAFGNSVTFAPGSSVIEPGATPSKTVTLRWRTFSDAANQAGISRRYGGIHFKTADLTARLVGRIVGYETWHKAKGLWEGMPCDRMAAELPDAFPSSTEFVNKLRLQ